MSRIERSYKNYKIYEFLLWSYKICENYKKFANFVIFAVFGCDENCEFYENYKICDVYKYFFVKFATFVETKIFEWDVLTKIWILRNLQKLRILWKLWLFFFFWKTKVSNLTWQIERKPLPLSLSYPLQFFINTLPLKLICNAGKRFIKKMCKSLSCTDLISRWSKFVEWNNIKPRSLKQRKEKYLNTHQHQCDTGNQQLT